MVTREAMMGSYRSAAGCAVLAGSVLAAAALDVPAAPAPADGAPQAKAVHVDRSGKPRKGKASYYSHRFSGKKMANGEKLDPHSNEAASKALPLGTTARVTNLENDQSAVVVVKDRGPYVPGRIIDVTPSTAEQLGMKKDGVAPVEVKPLKLPPKAEASAPEGKARQE
jgi:rare lipoprotein A